VELFTRQAEITEHLTSAHIQIMIFITVIIRLHYIHETVQVCFTVPMERRQGVLFNKWKL
jgi:hypothetical protein